MNETVVNETELIPRQWYDYEDRNISDFVMYMFTNFAKYGYVQFIRQLILQLIIRYLYSVIYALSKNDHVFFILTL